MNTGGRSERMYLETDRLRVGYTDQKVTPWSGVVLLHNFSERSGLLSAIKTWSLPMPGSNRGYAPNQMIEQMLCSIWTGAGNYRQLDLTRLDPVLGEIFGWNKVAEHKAIERFLNRFDQEKSTEMMRNGYSWFFRNTLPVGVVVDVDSTALPRHGQQLEGAVRGYNPKYRGRPSHHPIIAMIAGSKMVANMWLRSGNSGTSNNLTAFLDQTQDHLGNAKIALLRADSGFWNGNTFDYLRKHKINYIISTKITQKLQQHMLKNVGKWMQMSSWLECAEMQYQSEGWSQPERIVIVRQRPPQNSDECPGKQLALFKDDPYQYRWRYSMMTTSLDADPDAIWRGYRGRADCENRIKELKEDFGMNSFVLRDFWATEAGLSICMLAYNMISAFRQLVLKLPKHPTLKTIQRLVLNFAALLQIDKDVPSKKPILRLAIPRNRRKWFEGLWYRSLGKNNLLPNESG